MAGDTLRDDYGFENKSRSPFLHDVNSMSTSPADQKLYESIVQKQNGTEPVKEVEPLKMKIEAIQKVAQETAHKIKNEIQGKATRHNAGKPQYSLLNLKYLEPCTRALEYGATAYGRDNYKKGLEFNEVLDSMLRHIADLQAGIFIDKDSGQSTIGCLQSNAYFLGQFTNKLG